MPRIHPPEGLRFRQPLRGAWEGLSLRRAAGDAMFAGNAEHYLRCGASALTALHAACLLAGLRPRSILDFGSGAGRVTRWLRAHWPDAQLSATDLRAEDLEFCAAEFGCTTWVSGTDIAALQAPGTYDLIWAGSVLTHLDRGRAEALVARLLSWTRPGGLVVASLHGRSCVPRAAEFKYYGLERMRWYSLVHAFGNGAEYVYADYPQQLGYGISVVRASWIAALVEANPGTRLALHGERLWDDHHDVIALLRAPEAEAPG
jgi:SAM-dependent methyltransferase